ncbi:hypothetical protein [Petroclostridium sp. X23]|uniref:hypothetical protein n=1 Tax=Petroclostridium sp. X23 TaxID=3045146 RepID=UPI0024AD40E6|nr:hypothetical protein [Petroclostridium sp. X23]WHH58323.1 hypothetical protein QKW49_21365 [Petroclostridium sp. X23]
MIKATRTTPVVPKDPTPEEQIATLQQELNQAKNDTLTAYEAMTEVYELALTLQIEVEALKGGTV